MNRKLVSEVMVTLLLLGMLALTFNVHPAEASGTIYIRADGSVEGTPCIRSDDNVTYTFTDNIYGKIVVERDNIVVDGANYTVLGAGANLYSKGINLAGRRNVTLRNMSIEGFYYGAYLDFSSSNSIFDNNMTNNEYGIRLDNSLNNSISRNDITANNEGGVWVFHSSFNSISGNNVTANSWEGILLIDSFYNIISENNASNNADGIILADSSFNSVSRNNITANKVGIPIVSSSGSITSSGNIIFGNDLVANSDGILFHGSLGNSIYHNNFLDNTRQVYDVAWTHPVIPPSINSWDDGYPSGGNFWSDYTDEDLCSGPYQNVTGGDGVWDHPYEIDADNVDNYPLVEPWSPLPRTIGELKTEIEKCWSEGEIDNQGIVNSLLAKLNVAQKLVDKGKIDEAKSILEEDFVPQVQNLSGIHITPEAADILIKSAEHILSHL